MPKHHVAFLDNVTGYLGRWMLFWFLEELPNEQIAVLIRPHSRGRKVQEAAEQRLDETLAAIGMSSERHRITVIPGDVGSPFFGNRDALESLQADSWIHLAGDVRFKQLGNKGLQATNYDCTINLIETARQITYVPRTVCHVSTFFVFEKASQPDGEFFVPEDFHDPDEMEHHNAYGYSKLAAETYLHSQVRDRSLPFNLLVFRPDIIMHHIPVKEVAARNPDLVTDDFKVIYQLLAACIGRTKVKIPGGPSFDAPLKYLPVCPDTVVNLSDVDSVTKSMMQLTVLHGDGGLSPDDGYQIFHLVNRWRPVSNGFLRELTEAAEPERARQTQIVSPHEFQTQIMPKLSWVEKLYYAQFVEPFLGYMHRARTHTSTANVDNLLGDDWHHFHPIHQLDIPRWLEVGARQAIAKDFGNVGAML
ncbi:MAG: SDR family oxidoreductase [Elainellaceae cyanobacterium]